MRETKLLQHGVVLPPERKVSAADRIISILERIAQFNFITTCRCFYLAVLIRRVSFCVDITRNKILPLMPANTSDSLWLKDISDNPADILIGQLTHLEHTYFSCSDQILPDRPLLLPGSSLSLLN